MDNSAIERIAASDLAADALALLGKHGSNDDAVFFLGRLVWQGSLAECVPVLANIACDPGRGFYARIAAIRGVMSVGDATQKDGLWEAVTGHPGPLERRLLAELLEWAPATTHGVQLLLRTIEVVAPFERFTPTGLEQTLHAFVDRLPIMVDGAGDNPLGRLVEGFGGFLAREPFIERRECLVSKEFAWLMAPALHAVDRLVAARCASALSSSAIDVLRNMPALHHWQGGDFSDYKLALGENVPRWQELNDLLYWTTVAKARAKLAHTGALLVDDWQVSFSGHFWRFGPGDFERCLDWVRTRRDRDDRQVALSRCVTLYIQANRPAAWLQPLQAAVQGDGVLAAELELRLDSKPSSTIERMDAEQRKWRREREAEKREEERRRADWVRELKNNPDRVLHPVGLKPGEFSRDQYHLLASASGDDLAVRTKSGTDWRRLVPEFGEAVARAYRDAAVSHWRVFRPELRSEGADTGSFPSSLVFAMTGLAIEFGEDSALAQRLTPEEARHAFRYVIWELNGFPDWFEALYRTHPRIGLEIIAKELTWELRRCAGSEPFRGILHDILYRAPWLHADVAPLILEWLSRNDMPDDDGLRHCLNILAEGGVSTRALIDLARNKIDDMWPAAQQPRWFALWADVDPDAAIPALGMALEDLPPAEASNFAQQFVVSLVGDRHGTGTRVGAYRNARDLKEIFILMHRYIRVADDFDRAGKGVYTPTLRDGAQEARDRLFTMLAAIPGAETYVALKKLEEEHPELGHRRWMARHAHRRAEADADEPLWTVEQVLAFVRGDAPDQRATFEN